MNQTKLLFVSLLLTVIVLSLDFYLIYFNHSYPRHIDFKLGLFLVLSSIILTIGLNMLYGNFLKTEPKDPQIHSARSKVYALYIAEVVTFLLAFYELVINPSLGIHGYSIFAIPVALSYISARLTVNS